MPYPTDEIDYREDEYDDWDWGWDDHYDWDREDDGREVE